MIQYRRVDQQAQLWLRMTLLPGHSQAFKAFGKILATQV
jgi:hypothetical protein